MGKTTRDLTPQVKAMSLEELKALEPIAEKLAESKKQLENYRETLLFTYKDTLRLRTYSVLSVGYERLVHDV